MKLQTSHSGKNFSLPQDCLPLALIFPPTGAKVIMDDFQFRNMVPAADSSGLEFFSGSLTHDGKTITITRLHLTPNSVTINVAGRTESVDPVFKQVTQSIQKISKDYMPDVRRTHEWSTCTAQLDFEFSKIFNDKFYGFMTKKMADASNTTEYKTIIEPRTFRATIKYSAIDPSNTNPMPSQEIYFEPRAGTQLSERVYFSSGLFSSATHFKLLEDLERDLK